MDRYDIHDNGECLCRRDGVFCLWSDVEILLRERDEARAVAFHAFLQGAKWWQFTGHGSTAFPSEQDEMAAEAERRYPFTPHPLVMAANKERDEAHALLREILYASESGDFDNPHLHDTIDLTARLVKAVGAAKADE